MNRRQKFFRLVGILTGLILVLTAFYYALLENAYVNHPRQAQPGLGLIVPHDVKGITVYITQRDRDILALLKRIGIGSGALFIAAFIGSGEAIKKLRGD